MGDVIIPIGIPADKKEAKTPKTDRKKTEKTVTKPAPSVGKPVTTVVGKPVTTVQPGSMDGTKLQKPVEASKLAEPEPEELKVDYTAIIKPHSYVYHKKFGKGFVTTFNASKGFVWVRFMEGENKGEKKFDFPGSFENGFLQPM